MNLSLRTIAHNRYGLTGHFSVRGDVLGKLDPSVNVRTADGAVSLRLILTPPLKPKIVSFSARAAGPGKTNPVAFAWQVEPPTPWLKGNTDVTLLAKINVGDTHPYWSENVGINGAGLSGMTTRTITPVPYTYAFELAAYVRVPGGTDGPTTQAILVEIETNQPPAPPPPPPAELATLYLAYEFDAVAPGSVTVQFSGSLNPGMATGPTGIDHFGPIPGTAVVGEGPNQVVPSPALPGLRPGTWTVTAVSPVGAPVTCNIVRVPGAFTLSVAGGVPEPQCIQNTV
jgi:hypothetical protein